MGSMRGRCICGWKIYLVKCGGGKIIKLWRREQKIEGNVVKKDSLLSLTLLIDSFQIAVYLTLFVTGF